MLDHDTTANYGNWIEIALVGVKNLKSAIGAKVEVKAGTLYEKQTYEGLPLVFRLGSQKTVDTVRITWPNGLIQNEMNQPVNKLSVIKEAQRLSGSCPMIFTWDGSRFVFITDVLGVAPLGASSGDGQYFPVDHDEYVSIPGEMLKERDGAYEVRVTEELHEVSYLDQIRLQAVDHPADTEIVTNEKFKSPPFPEFRLFGVKRRVYPLAKPGTGLPEAFRRDTAGVAEMHHLDLDFGKAAPSNHAVLMFHGWVDWADGSTFLSAMQEHKDLTFPYLQVKDAAGNWKTVVEDMGIPSGKPKTMAVDLTGKFLSDSREVRIVTNLCVYWDEIFLVEDDAPPAVRLSTAPRTFGGPPVSRLLETHHPPAAQAARALRLSNRQWDFHVEPDARKLHPLRRRRESAAGSRRPHGDHGLGRRGAPALRRSQPAAASRRLEARFPAAGGWLGEGCRRQHGVFADRAAAAVPRHEQLSVSGRRTLSAGSGSPGLPARIQHTPCAAADPAAAPAHRGVKMSRFPEEIRTRLFRPRTAILSALPAAAILAAWAAVPPAGPVFTDVTAQAGIHFTHNSGRAGRKYLPETLGSGCAFVDLDGDGWADILLVNSKDWTPRGRTSLAALYHNNHNGTFTDVTAGSGLDVEMYGMGVAVADYDNDGRDDIYITALDGDRLFHNEGNGKFRDVTKASGIQNANFGTSAAWLDYDRDGKLDLFVANYVQWSAKNDLFCSLDGAAKSYCTPESYKGTRSRLFHNLGGGRFEDVSEKAGVGDPTSKSLGVTVLDYNGDGWPDLFVANDTQPNKLYRNNKNGTFTEEGMTAGVAYGEDGVARGAMGADSADYDRSGRPHLLVGNFSNQMLGLYHNEGNGLFVDEAPSSAVGRASLLSLAFGVFFFDYDLDGHPDIFAGNGHIEEEIGKVQPKVSYREAAPTVPQPRQP